MAHMGFDRGQLDVHNLPDLCVALVCADQVQNLQLHGRQRLTEGKPRLQKAGVIGCLRPYIGHQPLMPFDVSVPLQFLQQRQNRRAIDADGADKAVLRRRIQRASQPLLP